MIKIEPQTLYQKAIKFAAYAATHISPFQGLAFVTSSLHRAMPYVNVSRPFGAFPFSPEGV